MEKIKLIESFIISVLKENVEIFDKPKLVESSDGSKFKARGIIRNADVTMFEENENGRTYPKELWENVRKSKIAEGNLCLGNHPESGEGDVRDISGVWHNFKVLEKTAQADLYCIGELGSLMLETLSAGGKVGFSTVGYGTFLEDNKTVNPDTYDLERLADWVINPSAGVFATQENIEDVNKEEKIDEKIDEKKEEQIQFFDNKYTNNKQDINNSEEEIMTSKLHEANLKNQVRVAIREAKKSDNYNEVIEDLSELYKDIPSEMIEERNKVQSTIKDVQNKLDEKIKTSEKENEDLKSKYETTSKALEEMTERYEKVSQLFEKIGVKPEELETLKEGYKELEDAIKIYEEDTVKRDYDIKCLLEDKKKMENDIENFEKDLEKAENYIKECHVELKKHGVKFEEDEDEDEEIKDVEIKESKKKEQEDDMEKDKEDEEEMEEGEKKEQEDDDENNEKEDEKEEKKEEKIKEEIDKVKIYFDEMVQKYPGLKDVEKEILSSKSIIDAHDKIEAFRNKNEELVKVNESKIKTRPDWLGNRK